MITNNQYPIIFESAHCRGANILEVNMSNKTLKKVSHTQIDDYVGMAESRKIHGVLTDGSFQLLSGKLQSKLD